MASDQSWTGRFINRIAGKPPPTVRCLPRDSATSKTWRRLPYGEQPGTLVTETVRLPIYHGADKAKSWTNDWRSGDCFLPWQMNQ